MVMVTVWWSATCLIHYSFLSPGKTITSEKYTQQINEIQWKLQCLQPAFVNRMGPILHENAQLHTTRSTRQKLNELGYEVLPHPLYLPDLSPTDNHFFKYLDNFLQEKHFHNQQEAECFARVHRLLKHRFLCYRNKQTFLIGKNVLIVMVLILINKDMFELSYNDNSWSNPQLFLYQPNNNISLGEDVE